MEYKTTIGTIVAEKLGVSPEEAPEQLSPVRLFDVEENKTIGFNPTGLTQR